MTYVTLIAVRFHESDTFSSAKGFFGNSRSYWERAIHNIKAILSSELTSDAAMNAVYGCLTRVERD